MVAKVLGVDQVIDGIIKRLRDLQAAHLIDDYAEGKDSGIIDLLLVGDIDDDHFMDLRRKTERYIKRKIRTMLFNTQEFERFGDILKNRPHLLIWLKSSALPA